MITGKIGARRIGEGAPAFILGEVASAHQGEADQAIALAKSAQAAGAEAVKFQLFRAEALVAPNDPNRATFDQIELEIAEWERVLGEAKALDVPVFADVFDRRSLELGEKMEVAAYKIHSTDMENPAFIHAVAATGKPVLLSTGGSGLGVVEASIDVVRSEGNENLMLLHGVQNFPTKTADSHLRYIETLKRLFGLPVGFLDHVDGGSKMAAVLPALAVAFGADLVEKHMTLDRAAKGFDYQSALEVDGFRKMVALIREAETAFGEPGLVESEGASRYHGLMRRAVMSAVALPQGEAIVEEQLVFLRNEKGLSPCDAQRIVGRKPRRDIAAFEPLTEDLFE